LTCALRRVWHEFMGVSLLFQLDVFKGRSISAARSPARGRTRVRGGLLARVLNVQPAGSAGALAGAAPSAAGCLAREPSIALPENKRPRHGDEEKNDDALPHDAYSFFRRAHAGLHRSREEIVKLKIVVK